MKTVGTGVTGRYVTFGSMPVVFWLRRRIVGTGVADRFVTFGIMLVVRSGPGDIFPWVLAKTTPGSKRMMMHRTAAISRNPDTVSRTIRIEKPLSDLLEIS
jgi:hypothetical protein